MSEIKASLSSARGVSGAPALAPVRRPDKSGVDQVRENADRGFLSGTSEPRNNSTERLIREFIQPPEHVRAWLSDPMIGPVLAEISRDLAPSGVASDAQARYTASVIETHLSARKQLASRLNALIRA